MMKIRAIVIISDAHFKTTGCCLAYSLGEKKTTVKTFQLFLFQFVYLLDTSSYQMVIPKQIRLQMLSGSVPRYHELDRVQPLCVQEPSRHKS